MRSAVILMGIMAAICLPAIALRISGTHLGTVSETLLFGLGIVAAAFLLSWAAEAAEVDISQGLAVAFIAFIAVLPEYAVDLAFAWKAGQDPEFAPYAVANMTGANRLLIGVGWSAVFLIFWLRTRGRVLRLHRSNALDVVALGAATLYSFTLPFKGSISLIDSVVLFAIFAVYVYGVARTEGEEHELVGPAHWIGHLPEEAPSRPQRRHLHLRGHGHPGRGGAVRGGADPQRHAARHRRVPARAVARAVRLGGPRSSSSRASSPSTAAR